LRRRITSYATILFTISVSFFAVSAVIVAVVAGPAAALGLFAQPQCHAHFAATGVMLLLWLLARFATFPYSALRVLDAAATFAICFFFTGMYVGVAPESRPELVLLLTMNFVLVTRAATVPSTPLLSLAIGVPSVIPTIVVSAILQKDGHAQTLARTSAAVYAGTWAGVALVTSTMISRAIYGLSRQVAEARQVGQYTLEECIGKGGMGEVYRARHALLRRPTAVKLLRADVKGGPNVERFEREVQLTSQLRHPNTVAIYDYGHTLGGVFYYAMEFLDGIDLDDLVEVGGPQSPARVARILKQTCGALEEAHAAGLIHRDVKPANIFLCERHGDYDVAKVVDFGLVKEVEANSSPAITRAAALVGTPLFMAPEAIVAPEEASPKSDLYALGGVAYFLLTGSHVFRGDSTLAICTQHLHTAPEAPSVRIGKPLPPALEAVVLACLAKDPSARPASAASLADVLDALDVKAWNAADSEVWWREHRQGIHAFRRKRAQKFGQPGSETVAVNLTQRVPTV
jgi:serine/threonine-protein kinase